MSNISNNSRQLSSPIDSLSETNKSLKGEAIPMQEAEVIFYPHLFVKSEADTFMQKLANEIEWRQDKMKIYGKEVNLPRLIAWYGDDNKSYTFSGISLNPLPWTPTLLHIKNRIEELTEVRFNSVLLNYYRSGSDSMSWHRDDEPELGKNPVIGSVSFGGTRRFIFRYIKDRKLRQEIALTHGSFLLMAGSTQHFWQHQVPKTSKKVEPRINLTFRTIAR